MKKNHLKKMSMTLITVDTLKAFYELGSLVEDKNNSVIATPWSYGYQAILYSGIPTFLDGGALHLQDIIF